MSVQSRASFASAIQDGLLQSSLVLGLCLLLSSFAVQAQPRVNDVKPLLEGYEWKLDAARFICMGKGADRVLRKVASDATLPNYYRLRALTALGLFPNPKTASFLEQMISDSGSHPSQVQQALYAYSLAYHKQPRRVMEVARNALLSTDDYQVQTAAAETLASLRTPESKDALRGYLKSDLSNLQRQRIKMMMRKPGPTSVSSGTRKSTPRDQRAEVHDCS